MTDSSPDSREQDIPRSEGVEAGWLSVVDVVLFFSRQAGLILGIAAALTVVATFAFLLLPRKYEASMTLVVSPPTFNSELSPSAFSVQGYQALLESGAVLEETTKRLVDRSVLSPGKTLRLDEGVYTSIFVSSRSDATALAPMLRLTARTKDPEIAAEVANTWAEVFLEHTQQLSASSLRPTLQVVEDQFEMARSALENAEQERLQLLSDFQVRFDEATGKWDERIAKFRAETEVLVSTFREETRQQFAEVGSEYGLTEEPSGPQQATERGSSAQRLLSELLVLRQQLAQTPGVFELQKAITDDVLWQALAGTWEEGTEDRLFAKNLITEEVNPVFTELATRIMQLESQSRLLLHSEQEVYWQFDRAIEKLQRERSVALTTLRERREVGLAALTRQRRRELSRIRRVHEAELAEMERRILRLTAQVEKLSISYNEVVLARARQEVPDVQLAVPAVPPSSPLPRGLVLKVVVVAFLGGLLGLAVAFLREVSRRRT